PAIGASGCAWRRAGEPRSNPAFQAANPTTEPPFPDTLLWSGKPSPASAKPFNLLDNFAQRRQAAILAGLNLHPDASRMSQRPAQTAVDTLIHAAFVVPVMPAGVVLKNHTIAIHQ